VALWREALLARAVLQGETRGYRHHPQLTRFLAHDDPVACINRYLSHVHAEACERGYAFDARKLVHPVPAVRMTETHGQLAAEWEHLLGKLRLRRPERYRVLASVRRPLSHPLFRIVRGSRRAWERSGVSSPAAGVHDR
jgi:hypothetical protein